MICHLCETNKLSSEFPYSYLTEKCADQHPLLHCLRCLTASVRDHQKCSQCDVHVTEDNEQYKEYVETLDFLFPSVDTGDNNVNSQSAVPVAYDSTSNLVIYITNCSGNSITIAYNPNQSILNVMTKIEDELKIPCKKQCLLYNNVELEATGKGSKVFRLKDYNVPPNSTISLLVLLYEVPEDFNHVVFDLIWRYPRDKIDALDASVFLYSGTEFIDLVNYKRKETALCPAVKHSGDNINEINGTGYHRITVSMKSIPSHIDRLVFTLSAWNSKLISKFPQLRLKLFDERFPREELCDEYVENTNSQAIIVCFLTNRGGIWRVVSVKSPSNGNAMDYEPLKNSIVKLIRLEEGSQ